MVNVGYKKKKLFGTIEWGFIICEDRTLPCIAGSPPGLCGSSLQRIPTVPAWEKTVAAHHGDTKVVKVLLKFIPVKSLVQVITSVSRNSRDRERKRKRTSQPVLVAPWPMGPAPKNQKANMLASQ